MKKRMSAKNVDKKNARKKNKGQKSATNKFSYNGRVMFTIDEVNRVNTIFDDEKPFE